MKCRSGMILGVVLAASQMFGVAPARAHCWPEGSVPCSESARPGEPVVILSDGSEQFLNQWSTHNVRTGLDDGVFTVGELAREGEHFIDRSIRFVAGRTVEIRATIGRADRPRVRLYLTGGGPSSAFCDFDLVAGTVVATGAFGGATHRKPAMEVRDDGARELVCRARLDPGQSVSGVRIQLLDDAGVGSYFGAPEKQLVVSSLVVNTY